MNKKNAEHNTRRFIDPDENSRLQLLEGEALTYYTEELSCPTFHPVLL